MRNKKGFTLAELLIVVAIIAVLVAIAVPVFSAQLNSAGLAADAANERILKAYGVTLNELGELTAGGKTITIPDLEEITTSDNIVYCYMNDGSLYLYMDEGTEGELPVPPPKDEVYFARGDGDGHSKGQALTLWVSYSIPHSESQIGIGEPTRTIHTRWVTLYHS